MALAVEIAMAVVETLTEKEEIVITMDELPLLKIGQFHYQEMRELKMNYLVRNIFNDNKDGVPC